MKNLGAPHHHHNAMKDQGPTMSLQLRNMSQSLRGIGFYDDIRQSLGSSREEQKFHSSSVLILEHSSPSVLRVEVPRTMEVEDNHGRTEDEVPTDNIFDAPQEETIVTTHESVDLRHLVTFLPFTMGDKPTILPFAVDTTAAALMAVHHFNNGMNDVVPQVPQNCRIKFTLEFVATRMNTTAALQNLVLDFLPRLRRSIDPLKPAPTALVGGVYAQITDATAKLTGMYDIPQISHFAPPEKFSNKDKFPLLARTGINNGRRAAATVDFLHRVIGTTHVAIVHLDTRLGKDFARCFERKNAQLEQPLRVELITVGSSPGGGTEMSPQKLAVALARLQQTGYRHVVVQLPRGVVSDVMLQAHESGLTGPHMLYVFVMNSAALEADLAKNSNETIREALQGSAAISLGPRDDSLSRFTQFSKHFQKAFRSSPEIEFLRQKLPKNILGLPGTPVFNASHFRLRQSPPPIVVRMYDTIMALGLASCRAANYTDYKAENDNLHFTGRNLFDALVQDTTFDGAEGRVGFDDTTGNRHATLPLAVYNLRQGTPKDGTSKVEFHAVYTYRTGTNEPSEAAAWTPIRDESFRFANGSNQPPDALPPLHVRTLPLLARSVGLCLSGAAIVLAISFAAWTVWRRKSPVVRASQPIFLRLVCTGALLMGVAGVVDSLQDPVDESILNMACIGNLWFFGVGYTMTFAALHTKLRRVNRVVHGRDHIKTKDLMRDYSVLLAWLFVAIQIFILTLWTMRAPPTYTLFFLSDEVDEFDRPVDGYGTCCKVGNWESLPYEVAYGLVLFICTSATLVEAYKARWVEANYSESHNIFMAEALMLETFLIYLPIRFMGPPLWDSVKVITSPATAFLILLVIFSPKLCAQRQQDCKDEQTKRKLLQDVKTAPLLSSSFRRAHRIAAMGPNNIPNNSAPLNVVEEDYGLLPHLRASRNRGMRNGPTCRAGVAESPGLEHHPRILSDVESVKHRLRLILSSTRTTGDPTVMARTMGAPVPENGPVDARIGMVVGEENLKLLSQQEDADEG